MSGKENEPKQPGEGWTIVLDEDQIRRSVTRIAHEILEKNKGAERLAVVGIRTRGEFLAKRIVAQIAEIEGREVPLGVVDITLYRDDISQSAEQPIVRGTDLPFDVDAVAIVLVDDVLFTGRTVRAALDAIIDFGRPRSVQLAVLCDRGHRELPIRADYIGKSIPTARTELVEVCLNERDGKDAVYLYDPKKTER
jgi:pyrimidine operon attenuation protein/uracil phosphoribosyltransferase